MTGDVTGALDRTVTVEPGVRAVAVRQVAGTLELLSTHFPRFPVFPGVLIVDAIAATARLLAPSPDWSLAEVERVRFRHFVEPGDRMEIEVTVRDRSAAVVDATATVRVDGRTVVTARRVRLARNVSDDEGRAR